jgi:hypothetical protein
VLNQNLVHRIPEVIWPDTKKVSGRPCFCQVRAPATNLRILQCDGWELVQNPEFNHLVLKLKPGVKRTAEKWGEYFSVLGQDQNVIVKTYRFEVLLHRPICTWFDKYRLGFHYLHASPQVTYS